MTYNVHGCVGIDGRLDVERIAFAIDEYKPDVVALQELDVARTRSGRNDQAMLIANYLCMEHFFHPAWLIKDDEQYGDAILSRHPIKLIKKGPLPTLQNQPALEPRGALWCVIEKCGYEYHVINTHLGLLKRERALQTIALMSDEWVANSLCMNSCILCGDFNALPDSWVYKQITSVLIDSQHQERPWRDKATFHVRLPVVRLDYIFLSRDLEVTESMPCKNPLTRCASDHFPLIADIRPRPPAA